MVLICYDGSPDAKAAIQPAGALLPGQQATVLTVWQPFAHLLARSPAGLGPRAGLVDMEEIDAASEQQAKRRAAEGAELSRSAGFDAAPHSCPEETTVARAIVAEAEAVGASAIVIGSRGRARVKSLLLGSVSAAVIHHADLPVVLVPSREATAERRHDSTARLSR
jgi:nucleotide-binding universal stress UspA family protein